jgi:hypothetical protein
MAEFSLGFGSQKRRRSYDSRQDISSNPADYDPGGVLTGLPNRIAATISPNAPPGFTGGLRAFLRPNETLMADAHSQASQALDQAQKLSMPFQYGMVSALQNGNLNQAMDNYRDAIKPFIDAGLPEHADLISTLYEQTRDAADTQRARTTQLGQPDTMQNLALSAKDPAAVANLEVQRQNVAQSEQDRLRTQQTSGFEKELQPGKVLQQQAELASERTIPALRGAQTTGALASAGEAGSMTDIHRADLEYRRLHGGQTPPTTPAPARPSSKPQDFVAGTGIPVRQYPGDPNLYLRSPTADEDKAGIRVDPDTISQLRHSGRVTESPRGLRYIPEGGEAAATGEAPATWETQAAPAPRRAAGMSNREFINQPEEAVPPESLPVYNQAAQEIAEARRRIHDPRQLQARIAAILARLRPQGVPGGQ